MHTSIGRVLVFAIGSALVSASLPHVALGAGVFAPTAAMNVPRSEFTATRLLDGRVLVAGGLTPFATETAELYDPATQTWTRTGSLATARSAHSATLLSDGRVLVAGGLNVFGRVSSAELFDPVTGTWRSTGSMTVGRAGHRAVRLNDGKVFAIGGFEFLEPAFPAVDVYDPGTGTWSIGPSTNRAHFAHTVTALNDGRILVVGGFGLFAETYDATTNAWTATGPTTDLRRNHVAALLANGKVLVAGGTDSPALPTAELFDPTTNTWSATASLANRRHSFTATTLNDSTVLVFGGSDGSCCVLNAEIYNPSTAMWSTAGSVSARQQHSATLLADGRVLFAGGKGLLFETLMSADLYTLASGSTPPVIAAPANMSLNTDPGTCGAVVEFTFTVSDDSGIVTVTSDPPSGSVFPLGSTTVTGTATDPEGNTASATFTVTVNDNEPPQLVVPPNIVVNNDPGQPSAVVNYSYVATDNCPEVRSSSFPPSGTAFPVGTTIVSVSALDSHLLVGRTFDVTVRDAEPPSINITAPSDGVTYAFGQPVAADFSCADNVRVTSCLADLAVGGALDTVDVGAHILTVTANDGAGNETLKSASYIVDCPPTIRFPIAIVGPDGRAMPFASLTGIETRTGDVCAVRYDLVSHGRIIGAGTFVADHISLETTTISDGTVRIGRAELPVTFSGRVTRHGDSGVVTLTFQLPSGKTRTITYSFTETSSGTFATGAMR